MYRVLRISINMHEERRPLVYTQNNWVTTQWHHMVSPLLFELNKNQLKNPYHSEISTKLNLWFIKGLDVTLELSLKSHEKVSQENIKIKKI